MVNGSSIFGQKESYGAILRVLVSRLRQKEDSSIDIVKCMDIRVCCWCMQTDLQMAEGASGSRNVILVNLDVFFQQIEERDRCNPVQRHHTETLPSQIASITTLLGKGRASFCKHSDYCFLNFCRTYLTPFVFMLCRHPSSFSKPESFLFQTPCPADSAFWKKQVEIPLCFGIAHVLRLSSKICKCPVVFRLLADCPVP